MKYVFLNSLKRQGVAIFTTRAKMPPRNPTSSFISLVSLRFSTTHKERKTLFFFFSPPSFYLRICKHRPCLKREREIHPAPPPCTLERRELVKENETKETSLSLFYFSVQNTKPIVLLVTYSAFFLLERERRWLNLILCPQPHHAPPPPCAPLNSTHT